MVMLLRTMVAIAVLLATSIASAESPFPPEVHKACERRVGDPERPSASLCSLVAAVESLEETPETFIREEGLDEALERSYPTRLPGGSEQ